MEVTALAVNSTTMKKMNDISHVRVMAYIAVTLFLFFFDSNKEKTFPFCPFYKLTGLFCPGCGTMRASHFLLHGDFSSALKMNLLFVFSLPVIALLLFIPDLSYKKYAPWVALGVLVGYGVLRNIPIYPLTLLAPH